MSISLSGTTSSLAVLHEAETERLKQEIEGRHSRKDDVKLRNNDIEKQREKYMESLEDRIKQAAKGHSGCLKALKVITIVAGAVAAPITAGASMGLISVSTAALNIAGAAIAALGTITKTLQQYEEALKAQKMVATESQIQEVLLIIQDSQAWLNSEITALAQTDRANLDKLLGYQEELARLEQVFSDIIQLRAKDNPVIATTIQNKETV